MTEQDASAPLTPIQLGMLFQSLAKPGAGTDIEQIVGDLHERLDVDAFRAAFETVAASEARFRTFIDSSGDTARQVVAAAASLEWYVEDLSASTSQHQQERLDLFLRLDRDRGIDLATPPLSRVAIFRLAADHYRLVWTVHHILLDGWSFAIVLRRVFAVYQAMAAGQAPPAFTAGDFFREVPRLLERDAQADDTFWRAQVNGLHDVVGMLSTNEDSAVRETLEIQLDAKTTARLKDAAATIGVTRSTLLFGAWAIVLAHHAGSPEVVFGTTSSGRTSQVPGQRDIAGVFINTLPFRVALPRDVPLAVWLRELRAQQRLIRDHARIPLTDIQRHSGLPAGRPLFETLVVFDDESLTRMITGSGGDQWVGRSFRLIERTGYPVTLYARVDDALTIEIVFDPERLPRAKADDILSHLKEVLVRFPDCIDNETGTIEVLPPKARAELVKLGWGPVSAVPPVCVHDAVLAAAARHPDRTALIYRNQTITYGVLAQRVDEVALQLVALGVGADQPVALSVSRSIDMVVGLLGILRSGGAYVPLDPAYPAGRLAFMLQDSGARVLVTDRAWDAHQGPVIRLDQPSPASPPTADLAERTSPNHLAYVIYTSGSTGQPKGVMVEHRNVINFFDGMDAVVQPELDRPDGPGTWLAVTSLSFDISVLEVLYTLTRGFRVVIAAEEDRLTAGHGRGTAMSLFYFASGESGLDTYRLLIEGAKYADQNGFEAVWTPERHFHRFGGPYPNPAVVGAALAAVTTRVQIRAGSVVIPLHDPIRVAEEWAVVDNLSGGRVGISVASGWHPDDFVLAPDAHARRKDETVERLATIRRLWRGESLERTAPGGRRVQIRTLPRPVQTELPVWLTAAGNPDTFRLAGTLGIHVLTHLLGQSIDTVAANIAIYRTAWQKAGHSGHGRVTLMLHTFIDEDEQVVRQTVRAPMKEYLRSSVDLVRGFAHEWTAYSRREGATAPTADAINLLSSEETESLLDYAFERFYDGSALFGTPTQCAARIRQLESIGVDEVACLIDFGIPVDVVLGHLHDLDATRQMVAPGSEEADYSIGAQLRRHHVSHFQSTPSMARTLLADPVTASAMADLEVCLIGGEAFPTDLATEMCQRLHGRLINVYGPTETTIWSSAQTLTTPGRVTIGRPILNTTLLVLHPNGTLLPRGVAGELHIGGAGVVRGYLNRASLTAERFIEDRFSSDDVSTRLYRTGDLVRWLDDDTLEFLGRIDNQVKLRGHRIELGEIESMLSALDGVQQCVVVAREDRPGDQRLVAYVVRKPEAADVDAAAVKEHLSAVLPDFMVPQHVVFLDVLPQTPNRKIDRKALPAPESGGTRSHTYVMPTEGLEREISRIWQEVLGTDRVGSTDNFFDLGGHSILAVQVHGRLQRLTGQSIPITDLFRFPTVASLSTHLGGGTRDDAVSVDTGTERGQARRALLASRRRKI